MKTSGKELVSSGGVRFRVKWKSVKGDIKAVVELLEGSKVVRAWACRAGKWYGGEQSVPASIQHSLNQCLAAAQQQASR